MKDEVPLLLRFLNRHNQLMFSVDLKCRQCLKNVLIAMCLLTKGYAGQFPTCLYKYSLYEYVLICGIAKKGEKHMCLLFGVKCPIVLMTKWSNKFWIYHARWKLLSFQLSVDLIWTISALWILNWSFNILKIQKRKTPLPDLTLFKNSKSVFRNPELQSGNCRLVICWYWDVYYTVISLLLWP